jgi:hypothetical protein
MSTIDRGATSPPAPIAGFNAAVGVGANGPGFDSPAVASRLLQDARFALNSGVSRWASRDLLLARCSDFDEQYETFAAEVLPLLSDSLVS